MVAFIDCVDNHRVQNKMKLLLIFAIVVGTIISDDEILRPRPRGGPARKVRIEE